MTPVMPWLSRRTRSIVILFALAVLILLMRSHVPAQAPVSITVIPSAPRETDAIIVACSGGTTSNLVGVEKTLSVSGRVITLAVRVQIGLLTVIDSWDSSDTLGLLPPGSYNVNLGLTICHAGFAGMVGCDSVQRFTKDFGVTTGISSPGHLFPVNPVLDQNYPNPFNPSTTIRFGLPWRATVSLAVYSALGEKIATLADGDREAGFHAVEFNGRQCASGVYFYDLRAHRTGSAYAGSFSQTKRLLLIR